MSTRKIIGYGLIAVMLALAFTACDNGNKDTHSHDAGTWVITQQPTCTEDGVKERQCTVDHVVLETGVVPALGHDWNTETGLCNRNCGALYYNLGDTGPGGGKIFYMSAEGFTMTDDNATAHYLEAAPNDMATKLAWASSAFIPPNYGGTGDWADITGTATGIGVGRKNTALILATDANAPAAKACNDYNNGKTDWFLPSRDELEQLYVNRTSVGNLKTTQDNVNYTHYYWSSSHYSSQYYNYFAWYKIFSDGTQSGMEKNTTRSVRAVRAF
jgi:hypothetical protein